MEESYEGMISLSQKQEGATASLELGLEGLNGGDTAFGRKRVISLTHSNHNPIPKLNLNCNLIPIPYSIFSNCVLPFSRPCNFL